jgi:transcriptional regulator with XRE-family HTH domain
VSQDDLDNNRHYADRIRSERKRLGLNQSEMANHAGVELATQSRYELGKQRPKLDYLAAIATLGIDTQFILTGRHSGGDALSDDEGALVRGARKLGHADRHALIRLAAVAGGTPLPDTGPSLPSEDALARMFEGILTGEDLSADPSDVARMLARHLPAALERTRDVAPDPFPAASPTGDTLPPPPARPRRASPRSPRT